VQRIAEDASTSFKDQRTDVVYPFGFINLKLTQGCVYVRYINIVIFVKYVADSKRVAHLQWKQNGKIEIG
jgi:hypothetical protein